MELTTIQLTTLQVNAEEAKLFIMMRLLQSLGVFDIKNGNVTIHFDKNGGIGKIDIHQIHTINP